MATPPEKPSKTFRNAPVDRQRAVLKALASWPKLAGKNPKVYSQALHQTLVRLIDAWGSVWLNPEEGHENLRIRCQKGHYWTVKKASQLRRGAWCRDCYKEGSRSYSIEDMHQLAESWQGQCLSTIYHNGSTNLTWQCEHGHIWQSAPDIIKHGKWCPICRLDKQKAQSFAKIKALAQQRGGECLSEQYVSMKSKLKFRCSYGHVWETKPTTVKNGKASWCPICEHDKRRIGTLADLHAMAAKQGGLCLAKKYTNIDTPVEWQCNKGHTWQAPSWDVKSGAWCRACAVDKRRLTIEEMQEIAKSRGGQCLSPHYINSDTKLLWECHLGHQWLAAPAQVKKGTWCRSCFYLSRSKEEIKRQRYLPTPHPDVRE